MNATHRWLWVHGWGMSPQVWGDFPSLIPDALHRFVGYSECRSEADFRRTVRDSIASGAEPLTVAAWSMGAMLAVEAILDLLSRGDRRVRRLAIFGGTLRFADRDREKGWPPKVLDAMIRSLEKDESGTLRNFRTAVFGGKDMRHAMETDFNADGLASGLRYLKETDLRARWAQLTGHPDAPAIVWIHGAADSICPPGCVPEGAYLLKDCGHAPFADRPQACITLMEKAFGL